MGLDLRVWNLTGFQVCKGDGKKLIGLSGFGILLDFKYAKVIYTKIYLWFEIFLHIKIAKGLFV